ncbi:MAG: PEGA domain-containing protein [Methanoregulaceae archaeon]|nr:PEGA domain-containing protein [Methanoregulaceae archaeon]
MFAIGFSSAEDMPVGNVGGGKGYYDISSTPEGGTVFFDGKHKGVTPVTVEVSSSGTPGHTISISKAGYQTWIGNYPGNPSDGETIPINADLLFIPVTEPTPLPPTTIIGGGKGYYDISSTPEGGTVIFDGIYKGVTPVTVEVSSSGTPGHTISISKEGYQTWIRNEQGNPFEGETVHVDAELVFIPITLPTTPIGGEKGYYYVTSSPGGAAVTLDGTNQGSTPVTLEVSSTGTPGHTIVVSMPGYQSWSHYYPGNPPAGSTVNVNAVLSPMYQNGNIQVMSSPSGAYAVLDNGQNSLITPGTFSSVTVGWHNVRVTKSGYYAYATDIQVNAGGTTSVSANLVPVSQQGSISVSSIPSGAGLYVDTIYQGETNKIVGNLATGTHTVMLRKAGYQTWSTQYTVYSGQTTYVNAQLTPVSNPTTGDLEVISSPSGAAVYVDTDYQGSTSPGSPLDVVGLSQGTHTVVLKKSGYQDFTTTTNIRPGQTSQVSVTLVPSGQPPSTASVQISSDPSGADVLINNGYVGITPLTQNVQAGSSTIKITLTGYNPYESTMQISAGQALQINAALSPATTPTTKAPTSPLGVMLALAIAGIIATLCLQRNRE